MTHYRAPQVDDRRWRRVPARRIRRGDTIASPPVGYVEAVNRLPNEQVMFENRMGGFTVVGQAELMTALVRDYA